MKCLKFKNLDNVLLDDSLNRVNMSNQMNFFKKNGENRS